MGWQRKLDRITLAIFLKKSNFCLGIFPFNFSTFSFILLFAIKVLTVARRSAVRVTNKVKNKRKNLLNFIAAFSVQIKELNKDKAMELISDCSSFKRKLMLPLNVFYSFPLAFVIVVNTNDLSLSRWIVLHWIEFCTKMFINSLCLKFSGSLETFCFSLKIKKIYVEKIQKKSCRRWFWYLFILFICQCLRC